MDIRTVALTIGVLALTASIAISGDPFRGSYGGPSGCPPEEQPGDGGKDNSDPIYLATGDFHHVQTDLSIPGRGMDFEISRYYRSKSGVFGRDTTRPNGQFGLEFPWRSSNSMISDPIDHPSMGMNWDFNYNMRVWMDGASSSTLIPQPDPLDWVPLKTYRAGSLTIFLGNGRFEEFETECLESGVLGATVSSCVYTHDMYDKVVEFTHTAKPVYYRDSDNTVYKFNPMYYEDFDGGNSVTFQYAGRLASITDRNGNQITFTYETSVNGDDERIAYAIDTLGHQIDFRYYDDPALGVDADSSMGAVVWQIEDHAGRIVEYDYTESSSGQLRRLELSSVTLPAVTTTPEFPLLYVDGGTVVDHGRFANGRTWEYEYSGLAQSDMWFEGLLSKITDPNGNVILENEFLDDPSNIRANARVTRQVYGGDAYNYVATNTSGSTEFADGYYDQWGEDFYVWINDRRGVITRFKYHGNSDLSTGNDPMHLQLLEKVEYDGFVDNADQQVWGTCNPATGEVTQWNMLNSSGQAVALTGVQPVVGNVRSWTPNSNWSLEAIYAPTDGTATDDFTTIVYDDDSDNPLRRKTMTSRTQHSMSPVLNETITEHWHYGFEFAGGGGGSGCGCGGTQGFETGYKNGRGYVTIKDYDANGNLIKVFHDLPTTTPIDSDAAAAQTYANADTAIEEYTYNQWGQILTHTHPKKMTLDESGNEVLHPRVDRFVYYSDDPIVDPANSGRLYQRIIDSGTGGANLTTSYEYDIIGNIIKVTDPGGDITKSLYNQAGQLVREQHFAANGIDLFAEEEFYYDANGNLTIEEIRNLDGDQVVVAGNKKLTTVHGYDVLDFRIITSRERDIFNGSISEVAGVSRGAIVPISDPNDPDYNAAFVTQRWEFDQHRNVTMSYGGEAVNGNQSENVVKYEYDYRDLLVKRTTGFGEMNAVIATADYDEKGRVTNITLDPVGSTQAEHYEVVYDGFDRVIRVTDPMGNERHFQYDQNHNVTEVYLCGPLDTDTSGGGDSGDTLARMTNVFDERDRLTSKSIDVFDYDYATGTGETCGQIPGASTQEVTQYVYNPDSSIRTMKEPSGVSGMQKLTDYYYDTASRLEVVVDGDGNDSFTTYDADSNVLVTTYTDVSTIVGISDEVFTMTFGYDALHRRVSTIDSAGNQTLMKFDSRGNQIESIDARLNVTANFFDGLGRLTQSIVEMTNTGDGSGTQLSGADGEIVTTQAYDDSNRLISEKDDNDNVTSYEYDGLNRVRRIVMPDGEDYTTTYDYNGNVASYTDARGVVISHAYDLNNRLTSRVISGTSVPGVTEEIFSYDGLGRLREAINKVGMDELTKVVREYDSRSSVTREIQNIEGPGFASVSDRIVQYNFDEANNTSQIMYPSGRVINRSYDELNRLASIADPQMTLPITEFDYIGHRVQRRTNGNNTQTDYAYNGYTGYNGGPSTTDLGFGRVASISTTNTTTTAVLDAFDFAWDKSQNRTTYDDTGSGMVNRRERSFEYDSSNRLVSTDVDYPDPLTDYTAPTNGGITDYALDGVHNRIDVTGFEENGAEIGSYEINENNQYTASPLGGGADWVYLYDENGNMILQAQSSIADFNDDYTFNFLDTSAFLASYGNQDPVADINGDGSFNFQDVSAFMAEYTANQGVGLENRHYTYDYRNQLIRVSFKVGSALNSEITNRYDPLARRVVEELDADGDSVIDAEKQMIYGCASFWEVIEQIDLLNDEVLSTHVFGLGIDDEVHYQRPNASAENDIWSHRDDLNSLTSITDDAGDVLERYEYGDYGLVKVLDASGVVVTSGSDYSATHLYTGRLLLPGTELYDYRHRVLSSGLGRFVQRDPLGHIDGMNIYSYVSSSPMIYNDPLGLKLKISNITGDRGKELADALEALCPGASVDRKTGEVSFDPCLGDGSPLCDAISQLVSSDKLIFITERRAMETDKDGNTTERPGAATKPNPSLNRISIHLPSGGIDDNYMYDTLLNRSIKAPDTVRLAHELGHAQGFDNGTHPSVNRNDTSNIPAHERHAVYLENYQRSQEGWTPRWIY